LAFGRAALTRDAFGGRPIGDLRSHKTLEAIPRVGMQLDFVERSGFPILAMPKKKLNARERRERRAGEIVLLVKQIGRKAQKGVEPNDRRVDEKLKRKLKHLKPEAMDSLLRDADD
jgi:hypothetical protein